MLKPEQESRIETWLTRGRSMEMKTRGPSVARSGPPPPSVFRSDQLGNLLSDLEGEIADVFPWIVVIDGSWDSLAQRVFEDVRTHRENARIWFVGPAEDAPSVSPLLHLDSSDHRDQQFLKNLVADLAILTPEPASSLEERMARWLRQARHLVLSRDGKLPQPTQLAGATARVYELEAEDPPASGR